MSTLGELLRKVSGEIGADLKALLGNMKSQDAELRTSVMKVFVMRSKKKLAQCYAITKWLSFPGIANSLSCVDDCGARMLEVQNQLGQQLDEVFFAHALIYSLRSRPLEVDAARALSSSGCYESLPRAVFSCGAPLLPDTPPVAQVQRDLDLYIRARLALHDELPTGLSDLHCSVDGGVLRLRCGQAFELALTLQHLAPTAPWNVLGCRILAADSADAAAEMQGGAPLDFSGLEAGVTTVLGAQLHTATAAESGSSAGLQLRRLVRTCHHAAAAASLRLLFRQAVSLAGGRWRGLLLAELQELPCSSRLSVSCWRSVFTRCTGRCVCGMCA